MQFFITFKTMKKPVIFLAFANDKTDESRYLRNLSDELHELREVLDKTNCKIIERANVRIKDIFDVFRENEVTIFHYGGHANDFQLLLESSQGNETAHAKPLMEFLASHQSLKLVFLNGCSTKKQTQELQSKNISVIGTRSEIEDEIAKNLAISFYKSLASFKTIQESWETAQNEIQTKKGYKKFRALYRKGKEQNEFPWELSATEKGQNWKLAKPKNIQEEYETKIIKLNQELLNRANEIRVKQNTIETHEMFIQNLLEEKRKLETTKDVSENEILLIQKKLDAENQIIDNLKVENHKLIQQNRSQNDEIKKLRKRIEILENTKNQAKEFIEQQQITDAKVRQGFELIQQNQSHEIEDLLPEQELIDEEAKIRAKQKEEFRPLAQKYLVKAFGATAELDLKKAEAYHKKAFEICPDAEFWFEYARFLQANFSDNQTVIKYYRKALQQTENQSNDEMTAMISYYLGRAYLSYDDFAQTEHYYNKSLKIYQNLDLQEDIGRMFVQLGDLYLETIDDQKALQNYNEARKIFSSNPENHLSIVGHIFNSLGILYTRYGKEQFDTAKHYLRWAITVRDKIVEQSDDNDDITVLLDSYYSLGNLEYQNKQYEEALDIFGMLVQKYHKHIDKNQKLYASRIATVLIVIGEIKIQQNMPEKALIAINKAKNINELLVMESPDLYHLELVRTNIMLCKIYKLFVEQGDTKYIVLAKNVLQDITPQLEENKTIPQVEKWIEQELMPLNQFFSMN